MSHTMTLKEVFAPKGVLRIALNHGNRVLVGRGADGSAEGISVDLAIRLADDLDLDYEFVEFDRAVDVSSSVTDDVWDIGFLAIDPKRAETIAFTPPYIRIEGCYLASSTCPAEDAHALLASGAQVGSVTGTAYALALSRMPVARQLTLFDCMSAAVEAFDRGQIAAIAGIRKAMEEIHERRVGSRVIEPPFMEILQAMAIRLGRDEAHAYLCDFLACLAKKGVVGDILERHGIDRSCAIVPD